MFSAVFEWADHRGGGGDGRRRHRARRCQHGREGERRGVAWRELMMDERIMANFQTAFLFLPFHESSAI